ncbi:MAG: hypothetical protein AMJ79_09795 [Phycisphaerae bacterium SM23_30]|nr:MAG: hypothetical protein AMJ79_09795 [Phycisphaerae bacterium SM23_30]
MKTLLKAAGLAGLCFLVVFGHEMPGRAGADQQRRRARAREQVTTNVEIFELEEFSVLQGEPARGSSYWRRGQLADETGDQPHAKVKAYPRLKSAKPVYGLVSFNKGPIKSNRILEPYYFVLDEAEGTGKGYDRFYFDLNHDFDLSNDQAIKATNSPVDKGRPDVGAGQIVTLVEIKTTNSAGEQAAATRAAPLRRTEVTFESFTLKMSYGRRGREVEFKLIPKLSRYGERPPSINFTSAVGRRGTIKLGEQEMEVVLAQSPYITGAFNNPNTGLFMGSRYESYAVLGKMRFIDGKIYTFGASSDGRQLRVSPYEGEFGLLQVGQAAGELKGAKFTGGVLLSRSNIIDLKDCLRQGNDVKLPVGDYRPLSLEVESEKLGTAFSQAATDDEEAEDDILTLPIRADQPYAFDFTHQLQVQFEDPPEDQAMKRGDRLRVTAMIHVRGLNLKLMGLDDRTQKTDTGLKRADGTAYIRYASLDPEVKITSASGKMVAEGKMPFG